MRSNNRRKFSITVVSSDESIAILVLELHGNVALSTCSK